MKRFGQRQLHGLTGYTPKGGVRQLLPGARTADEIKLVRRQLKSDISAAQKAGRDTKYIQGLRSGADKQIKRLGETAKRWTAAEKAGITSIPGIVKGLHPSRIGQTGKAMAGVAREGMGGIPGTLALPVAFSAPDLMDPNQGVGEKALGLAGDVGGMVATGGLGIVPQMVGWTALGSGGRALGRTIDRKRKPKAGVPGVSPPQPLSLQASPVQDNYGQ
jgi:hypothetical protein